MNLTAYLNQTVTPLSEYTPERRKPTTPRKRKNYHQSKRTLQEQGDDFRNKAIARYKAVMNPEGWTMTDEIDRRLGRLGGADRVMKRWLPLGIVERRPVGGVYSQARGFEWRFSEEEK